MQEIKVNIHAGFSKDKEMFEFNNYSAQSIMMVQTN